MNASTDTASATPQIPWADPSPKPYEVVRSNVIMHGILSRYTVLSHENHADYEILINSLIDEHLPANTPCTPPGCLRQPGGAQGFSQKIKISSCRCQGIR